MSTVSHCPASPLFHHSICLLLSQTLPQPPTTCSCTANSPDMAIAMGPRNPLSPWRALSRSHPLDSAMPSPNFSLASLLGSFADAPGLCPSSLLFPLCVSPRPASPTSPAVGYHLQANSSQICLLAQPPFLDHSIPRRTGVRLDSAQLRKLLGSPSATP